uniref:Peptide deformylase n=1 Tax=Pyrodinium bahamense TaxID=73915 RepID=A0A7S0B7N8_9DINO
MAMDIVKWDHPILASATSAVANPQDAEVCHLVGRMAETMRAVGGLGIAANQVGEPLRLFVMGLPGTDEEAFCNATVVEHWGQQLNHEGCLSFPGLFLPTIRPAGVTLAWEANDGTACRRRFGEGLATMVVCHECDHLNGTPFFEHLPATARAVADPFLQRLVREWEGRRVVSPAEYAAERQHSGLPRHAARELENLVREFMRRIPAAPDRSADA